MFFRLTNINQVFSPSQAPGWEPGFRQGTGQTHTRWFLGTHSLTRKADILMSMLQFDVESGLEGPRGIPDKHRNRDAKDDDDDDGNKDLHFLFEKVGAFPMIAPFKECSDSCWSKWTKD